MGNLSQAILCEKGHEHMWVSRGVVRATQTQTHTHTHTHTHTNTHTHTQLQTHTNTQHTHTYRHTQTQSTASCRKNTRRAWGAAAAAAHLHGGLVVEPLDVLLEEARRLVRVLLVALLQDTDSKLLEPATKLVGDRRCSGST